MAEVMTVGDSDAAAETERSNPVSVVAAWLQRALSPPVSSASTCKCTPMSSACFSCSPSSGAPLPSAVDECLDTLDEEGRMGEVIDLWGECLASSFPSRPSLADFSKGPATDSLSDVPSLMAHHDHVLHHAGEWFLHLTHASEVLSDVTALPLPPLEFLTLTERGRKIQCTRHMRLRTVHPMPQEDLRGHLLSAFPPEMKRALFSSWDTLKSAVLAAGLPKRSKNFDSFLASYQSSLVQALGAFRFIPETERALRGLLGTLSVSPSESPQERSNKERDPMTVLRNLRGEVSKRGGGRGERDENSGERSNRTEERGTASPAASVERGAGDMSEGGEGRKVPCAPLVSESLPDMIEFLGWHRQQLQACLLEGVRGVGREIDEEEAEEERMEREKQTVVAAQTQLLLEAMAISRLLACVGLGPEWQHSALSLCIQRVNEEAKEKRAAERSKTRSTNPLERTPPLRETDRDREGSPLPTAKRPNRSGPSSSSSSSSSFSSSPPPPTGIENSHAGRLPSQQQQGGMLSNSNLNFERERPYQRADLDRAHQLAASLVDRERAVLRGHQQQQVEVGAPVSGGAPSSSSSSGGLSLSLSQRQTRETSAKRAPGRRRAPLSAAGGPPHGHRGGSEATPSAPPSASGGLLHGRVSTASPGPPAISTAGPLTCSSSTGFVPSGFPVCSSCGVGKREKEKTEKTGGGSGKGKGGKAAHHHKARPGGDDEQKKNGGLFRCDGCLESFHLACLKSVVSGKSGLKGAVEDFAGLCRGDLPSAEWELLLCGVCRKERFEKAEWGCASDSTLESLLSWCGRFVRPFLRLMLGLPPFPFAAPEENAEGGEEGQRERGPSAECEGDFRLGHREGDHLVRAWMDGVVWADREETACALLERVQEACLEAVGSLHLENALGMLSDRRSLAEVREWLCREGTGGGSYGHVGKVKSALRRQVQGILEGQIGGEVPTDELIRLYIDSTKALKTLDPEHLITPAVLTDLQKALRQRPDSARCILAAFGKAHMEASASLGTLGLAVQADGSPTAEASGGSGKEKDKDGKDGDASPLDGSVRQCGWQFDLFDADANEEEEEEADGEGGEGAGGEEDEQVLARRLRKEELDAELSDDDTDPAVWHPRPLRPFSSAPHPKLQSTAEGLAILRAIDALAPSVAAVEAGGSRGAECPLEGGVGLLGGERSPLPSQSLVSFGPTSSPSASPRVLTAQQQQQEPLQRQSSEVRGTEREQNPLPGAATGSASSLREAPGPESMQTNGVGSEGRGRVLTSLDEPSGGEGGAVRGSSDSVSSVPFFAGRGGHASVHFMSTDTREDEAMGPETENALGPSQALTSPSPLPDVPSAPAGRESVRHVDGRVVPRFGVCDPSRMPSSSFRLPSSVVTTTAEGLAVGRGGRGGPGGVSGRGERFQGEGCTTGDDCGWFVTSSPLVPSVLSVGSGDGGAPRSSRSSRWELNETPGGRLTELLQVMTSVFGSHGKVVREFQKYLAHKILSSKRSGQGQGEVCEGEDAMAEEDATLRLLAARFGQTATSACRVMMKDFRDSLKHVQNVRNADLAGKHGNMSRDKVRLAQSVDALVVSEHYWPPSSLSSEGNGSASSLSLEAASLHEDIEDRLKAFADMFALQTGSRRLHWRRTHGRVELDISLEDGRVKKVETSFLGASLLKLFEKSPRLTLSAIGRRLFVDEDDDALAEALSFWKREGVIGEEGEGQGRSFSQRSEGSERTFFVIEREERREPIPVGEASPEGELQGDAMQVEEEGKGVPLGSSGGACGSSGLAGAGSAPFVEREREREEEKEDANDDMDFEVFGDDD
uniref:Cullin family profile domain-containing protein n=1 Tax=Chromera velia CCMP2878 TaxID=1169474 RepID=A0A0G4IBE3_9ALVE|eukprot:Cvel_12724.t1-p1 / transcript=Cvel_12724.t1 / gene=Cvel_12724 / organism=Chromera_velia_CCMP2878 / gene_product=Anaphase-promoting complex subunit 2, putative / transcript_product=Anaphase-promoting complex subunit 2, putative / location=Cvel_scaffold845:14618-26319(+) / protein_length=1804 / sequence_SO=supercontig / SO=protein_coding / is_pseudo=false